ncbi:septum formation protein Maf [bacterium]|nr:septum formation protein Maf [bacterium]
MLLTVPLILASSSPRRKDLLTATGFSFEVLPADVNEDAVPGESVIQMVERLAILKANTVSSAHSNSLVLGSDTTVELSGRVLGKPETPNHAVEMLNQLSGRRHIVHTSLALSHRDSNRLFSCVESTEVEFAVLSEKEIQRYVDTGSPMDKAGAYGIQDEGAFFVKGVTGDFYTVMGLPLHRLYGLLKTRFPDFLA